MSSRIAVLVTGAIAASLVARAALAYRGVDSLALGLVLLIGAGLAVGVSEGFVRASRAERLLREARALPDPASLEAVERASAPLRTFLEARIAGAPAVVTSAPFTPYLLGLLVMIGLLGTFLGLFETLRGAREALSASGDIATLRAGMAAPMTGLSRAFGTSAVGVSASAMLGLGAVFVRRAEGRVAAVLGRYATTTLVPLTLAGRQLAAVAALARSGEALPSAIEALLVTQRQATAEAAAAIRAVATDVRADIGKGIARAADAVTAAAEPLLTQTVSKVGTAAADALDAMRRRLDEDARAKSERDAEHLAALTAVHATQLASVSGQLADPLGRAAQAAEASVATAAKLVHGAQEQLGAEARDAAARGAKLDALITTLGAVAARVAEDAAANASLLETLARAMDTRTQTAEERAEARTTRLTEAAEHTVTALAERLALHATGLDESLRVTVGTVGEASQLLRSGGAEIVSVAEMFTAAVDRYRDASDRWLENLGALEDALARKDGAGDAAALLDSYVAQTREVFDHSLQFQRELFTELRALRALQTPQAEGTA